MASSGQLGIGTGSADAHAPLLDDFVDGSHDHKGQPVRRSSSGGWRSAGFIIGQLLACSNPSYEFCMLECQRK